MATENKNLSNYDKTKLPNAEASRFGIVVSQWNNHITHNLQKGAIETLLDLGAKEENISASEEDVEKELQTMAEMYKRNIDEIRSILGANGSLASLNDEITLRKTIEFLLENSKEVAASAE